MVWAVKFGCILGVEIGCILGWVFGDFLFSRQFRDG